MRDYFELNKPYHFEWNDINGPLNILSTFLVIRFGLIASWLGLAITLACIADDIIEVRRINITVLHGAILVLNSYFLLVYYQII